MRKKPPTALEIQLSELNRSVQYRLTGAVNLALNVGFQKGTLPKDEFPKWELAFSELMKVWGQLRKLRTKVRAKMRETRPWFQDACQHEHQQNVRTKYNTETRQTTVLEKACTACSKTFSVNEVKA